jgi:hypothetical protein
MARANLRGDLQERFEGFLGNARMHELYLIDNVLMLFESSNTGPASDAAESVLAEAFMSELGADHTYGKVARGHVEKVEEYVELLDKADLPGKEEDDA